MEERTMNAHDQTDAQRDARATDAECAAELPAPTKEEELAILLALDAEAAAAEPEADAGAEVGW
jgi:hypothetical protein